MTDFALFDLEDCQPRRWADAFPWLPGLSADGDRDPWWTTDVHDAAQHDRESRVVQVASLAAERLTNWTIGQIFPGLPPDLNLMRANLPTRAINALMRGKASTADALSRYRLKDVLDWPGVGVGTVHALLETLVTASLDAATPNVEVIVDPTMPAPGTDQRVVPEWIRSLIGDLTELAEWHAVVGRRDAALLDADALPAEAPQRVKDAQRRLVSLTVDDVLDDYDAEIDAAALLDGALAVLDPRAVKVLAMRLFADQPTTLDELGRSFGVTRERVRQIEAKASGAIVNAITDGSVLADVAAAAREVIGTIRPLKDLLVCIPALGRTVESVSQPAWRVLDRLDDAYEIEDGWCVAPSMAAAIETTQTQVEERSSGHGVARLEDLDLVRTSDPGDRKAVNAAWVSYCGYVVDGEHVLSRTRAVGDYAAAILSINGASLSAQEIVDRFVVDRSANSLKNAMGADGRFVRVDRDRWGLAEWGLEEYTSIRSKIREALAAGGGAAKLDDLVDMLTSRYTVAASSVVAYASAPPFNLSNGVVRFAGGERDIRKTPERTRRFFRRPGGWAYRVRITNDHLRGSGSVAPMAVASVLSMTFGDTIHMPSRLGDQAITWTGIQPAFGTIRRFLIEDDVAVGTESFLLLNDDGSFDFELAPPATGDSLQDAALLAGQVPQRDQGATLNSLATAVGLANDAPLVTILGRCQDRGDDDIAELLTAARDTVDAGCRPGVAKSEDTAVDDILDLL